MSELSEVVAGQVNERFLEVPTNSTYFADLATLNAAQVGAQNPFDAVVREVVDLRAAAGNMSAFDSRYKPLASDRWWINANEFVVLTGSPSIGTLNSGATALERTGVYLFDASTAEVVGAAFAPPPGWTTFTANIYWSNAGAGSGDVVWTVTGLALGDGDSSASVLWQGSNVTATAPAQNVVEVTAAGTTFTVSSGKIHRINLRRAASDAADTLANDAALIGIELVRAS